MKDLAKELTKDEVKKKIKKADKFLKENYTPKVEHLKLYKIKLERLIKKSGPKGIISAHMDITGIKGTKGQEETVNIINEIIELEQKIKELEKEILDIEELFDIIGEKKEIYKTVLIKIYKEGLTLRNTAEQIQYSIRQVLRFKKEALKELATLL
jgi:DNA-directed RNA polymerase specialized sigma subunit